MGEKLKQVLKGHLGTRCFHTLARLKSAISEGCAPAVLVAEPILSDGDFFSFVQKQNADLAFVIISREASAELIERSFRFGALDFFKPPVPPDLLRIKLQRIADRRVLQRRPALDVSTDILSLTVQAHGYRAKLTVTEFQIFLILRENYGTGTTRAELVSKIWGGTTVVTKTLDVHLFKLRRKIEPLKLQIDLGLDRKYQIRPMRSPDNS